MKTPILALLLSPIAAAALLLNARVPCRAAATAAPTKPPRLTSGRVTLQFPAVSSGRSGVRLEEAAAARPAKAPLPPAVFRQPAPLAVEVVDAHGAAEWVTGAYASVTSGEDEIICRGAVTSRNGTRFEFADRYRSLTPDTPGAFLLARTVRVAAASPADAGFSTRFSVAWGEPFTTHDGDFFVPGIWYRDNAHVPPTALASHLDDRYFYFREDRLPLPLVQVRGRRAGVTLTLSHVGGDPTTFAGEDGLARLIDARLGFGALGFVNTGYLEASFLFPGTEGARTYTFGGSREGNRWAYRCHPVREGFTQSYWLALRVSRTPDFAASVRQAWRSSSAAAAPPVIPADLDTVCRASMDLLATYCQKYHGVISLPFQVRVPTGEVIDTSCEMGFVGQALPAAALLLQHGLETGDAGAAAHATELIDFWAKNAPTPSGVPKQWYDIHPDGSVTWRDYATPLRVASDGLDGALRAWSVMRRRGQDRPEWLAFCKSYGDWLVRAQNPDGSWYTAYGTDGAPRNAFKNATDQPIPFLVDLYRATDEAAYRDAAVRAGKFCWSSVHEAYSYVGGTPDNPNVTDKEAGMMALAAFLALYDATGERRWLAAASQAAWFSETWVYLWNIPLPPGDPKQVFPRGRTTVGLSLIATGHSGADDYMAAAPFLFYRLYLLTGETHFRDSARLLLYDTKQMMDWDGSLGYRYPGLLTEALSLPPLRGHGVQGWLPWLTVATLDPMVRLRDTFGAMDIDAIERLPRAERLRRDALFSTRRGFPAPPAPAESKQ